MLFFLSRWIHHGLWVIQKKTNEMGSSFKFPRFVVQANFQQLWWARERKEDSQNSAWQRDKSNYSP